MVLIKIQSQDLAFEGKILIKQIERGDGGGGSRSALHKQVHWKS